MIDNHSDKDSNYQSEIVSQQQTMIAVLKEEILRLQG